MNRSLRSSPAPRLAGHALVDQLVVHGVEHVFCVPGESYLAVLDGLHDSPIQVTVCRQEGGAAMMAEAWGKLHGTPGICMVTRGPGAANALAGVHIAHQDSTPMILLVGQIERGMRGRDAFQEMDYRSVFGSQAKWVTEIDQADRIPELLSRAFHVATSGRPGPVVIALPEDMLTETVTIADAPRYEVVDSTPSGSQLDELAAHLAHAQRPIAILGGTRWTAAAVADFARFAQHHQLPVAVQFRRQMLFPADHPCFAGDVGIGCNPALLDAIRQADLVLLVGGRMSEIASQSYTLFPIPGPRPGQVLVHVHPDAAELNRIYRSTLAINSSPGAFAAAVAHTAAPPASGGAAPGAPGARDTHGGEFRASALHRLYQQWADPLAITVPGDLQMGPIMSWMATRLPPDAILCNGAGNFATWVHRFYPFRGYGTQLAPTSGSMGYGLPAAVAAKRIYPERTVVCFAGDGCFLMHGQEFATAVQYDLPIVVVLIDNSMYGTIRMHQETHYPARPYATALRNPDFAAWAQAFGGHGERVTHTRDFAPAFERALASGKPAILHCLIDPEAITPGTTLTALREKALARNP